MVKVVNINQLFIVALYECYSLTVNKDLEFIGDGSNWYLLDSFIAYLKENYVLSDECINLLDRLSDKDSCMPKPWYLYGILEGLRMESDMVFKEDLLISSLISLSAQSEELAYFADMIQKGTYKVGLYDIEGDYRDMEYLCLLLKFKDYSSASKFIRSVLYVVHNVSNYYDCNVGFINGADVFSSSVMCEDSWDIVSKFRCYSLNYYYKDRVFVRDSKFTILEFEVGYCLPMNISYLRKIYGNYLIAISEDNNCNYLTLGDRKVLLDNLSGKYSDTTFEILKYVLEYVEEPVSSIIIDLSITNSSTTIYTCCTRNGNEGEVDVYIGSSMDSDLRSL